MCQNNMVKTVVDGFVKKGFMFTAFDVTKFLRVSGSKVRHSDINTAVKQIFRDGEMVDYLRDTVNVGAPVPPFVYYHQNADVSNYASDWLENNPNQDGMKNDEDADDGSGTIKNVACITQPIPSTLRTQTYVTSPIVTSMKPVLPKGVKTTDKEGRLYISPIITHNAGLKAGQGVYVIQSYTKVILKPSTGLDFKPWLIHVNSDGRLRICHSILKQIIPISPLGYKISVNSGTIEIIPA